MRLVGAIAGDGHTFRQANGGFHVTQKSAGLHPFYTPSTFSGNIPGEKLTRPMEDSVWVMRAIKTIAGPISAVPLEFFQDGRGGNTLLNDPALAAFWEKPARTLSGTMGRADFIEATIGWLKLEGEAFWLLGDEWLTNRFATKREPMIVARPDKMRAVVRGGMLAGWQWSDAAGKQHSLIPDQVIHLKFWNPYDDLRGLAEYKAAHTAAESDFPAGRFVANLMRNNGDRGEYLVAKGAMPTDAQAAQIVRALREKKEMAQRGLFKPMFLTGDVAIEQPSISAPDANFVTQRLQNRHEIYMAFGVPPSMAEVMASFSIGSASDRFRLLEETSIPLANGKIADGIEAVSQLFVTGRPTVFAYFNFDGHSTMQAVRNERIDAGTKLWDRGMPWEKVNHFLDLGLPRFEGWEKSYLPFSVAEAGEEMPPVGEEDIAPVAEEPETPAEKIAVLLTRRARGGIEKARNPKRVALWKQHMRSRREAEKRAQAKFTRVLMEARKETLRRIEGAKSFTRAGAADFLFDLGDFTKALTAEMRKAAIATIKSAGQSLFAEIGKDDVFTMPPTTALAYLKVRDNRLVETAKEVHDAIGSALAEGISAGETMDAIAARVRDAFNGESKERAMRVAVTETSAAYGVSRQVAMQQAGIEFKQWLTSGDDRVRSTHLEADGQTVPLEEPFDVGGEDLMHPGDPSGSAANVINCRCVQIAVSGPEEPTTESDQ